MAALFLTLVLLPMSVEEASLIVSTRSGPIIFTDSRLTLPCQWPIFTPFQVHSVRVSCSFRVVFSFMVNDQSDFSYIFFGKMVVWALILARW